MDNPRLDQAKRDRAKRLAKQRASSVNPRENPNAAGPPKPTTGEVQTLKQQQFLALKRGWNLPITGKRDALTDYALTLWKAGVRDPKEFQAMAARKGLINGSPHDANFTGVQPARPTRKASGTPPLGVPDQQIDPGPAPASTLPVPTGNYGQYLLNPKSFATSAANLGYGAQIAELARQMAQAKKDGKVALGNIKNWYGQVGNTLNEGIGENTRVGNEALTGFDNTLANVAASLGGGDVGASVSSAGEFARAGILGDQVAEGNFNQRLKGILAAQRADALTGEQRSQSSNMVDLAGKLSDARKAKGDAYTQAFQQGNQTVLQQLAAIQNMQLAGAMAPYQLAGAAMENQQKGLDLQTTRAQFQDWLKSAGGGLNQQSAINLSDNLATNLVDQMGKPRFSLDRATSYVNNLLKSYQFDTNNPKVQNLRKLVLQRIYPGVTVKADGSSYK